MNDRVKELMKQAGTDCSGKWMGVENATKFAELIIKECVKVCNDIDAEYEGEDILATWCAKAIEERFGVEESKQEKFSQAIKTAFVGGIDLSGQYTP